MPVTKRRDRLELVHADHAVVVAAHPGVGLVGGALGEDLVSAVGTCVCVPTTRLARPSHQCPSAIFSEVASACTSTITALGRPAERRRLQRRVDRREGIVERPLHERLAEHLGDEHPPPAGRVEEARPPRPGAARAKLSGRTIRGSLLDVGLHLALVEGVVAERHAIGAGVEQQRGMRAAQPHAAGGVLAVDPRRSSPQSRRSCGSRSATAARPPRPITSPRNNIRIRPPYVVSP